MKLFIEIILIGQIYLINAEKYMKVVNCDCKVNEEYLNLTICNLKAISREKVLASVEFYMLQHVRNATAHAHLYKASGTGRYNPFLFDTWANVCQMKNMQSSVNYMLKLVARVASKFSNTVVCDHPVSNFQYLKKSK